MGLLVGDIVRHASRATPRGIAATLGDDQLTFGELEDRSDRVAAALAGSGSGSGIGPRDRVAWWGDTSLDAMPVFVGLAKLGAAFMPVNARLGAAEAAAVLEYARPRFLIVDDPHTALAEGIGVDVLTHDALFSRESKHGIGGAVFPAIDERDPHVIFFTSGSTGRPKGVVLSHRVSCLRSYPSLVTDHEGGTVCMFPLFHMAGWSMALNAWQTRRPVHLVSNPDADSLLSTVERHRATRLYCIPAVWSRVLDHDLSAYDLLTLRQTDTGTSATPPELIARLRDTFPDTVTRVFYGSTEVGPGTLLAHADVLRKPGSVGLPAPGVDLRITDDGEVCIRSECLMDGYFDDPDATAAALRDGWYHTGDLGELDDDGYLSIVGRARDVIRTGGETVAPTEVEGALATYDAIAEVAVVGVPDAEWGEVVCAVVVARPGRGGDVGIDALRAHCDGRLAHYKHPRRVELVNTLPRTAATGQVQRTVILERIAGADENLGNRT